MGNVGALSGVKHKSLSQRSLIIALGILISVSVAVGQSANSYVDAQQRFTIQVPPGWQAKPFNAGGVSGVTIAHSGDAYVQIFLQKGIDPATFLKALNNGVQTNHPGYHVLSRGVKDVAGQSRMYITGESPASTTAPHTQVDLETFSADGYTIAIIASASDLKPISKERMVDYQVAQGMIQSLSLNGVIAHGPSLAPPVPPVSPKSPPASAKPAPPPVDATAKGGAIAQEEYISKKNQAVSEQSAQQAQLSKLKLLDEAFESGVLTKEEYERKKKELGAIEVRPVSPHEQLPALAQSPPPVQTAEVMAKADVTPVSY